MAHPERGGTEAAIQHHYDVSNEFYALWLDETLTYSCAMWGPNVLDIGCGWGSLLERAVTHQHVETVTGLTLSDAQFQYIANRGGARLQLRKESWIDHQPAQKYDSIVSIGAFEHFASPGDSSDEKIGLYREFFQKCRSWLRPEGAMSLQTITYGTMKPSEAPAFINTHIFPDSELPQLHEIVQAANGLFEITLLRNDRAQYGQTCDLWHQNLRRRRAEAVAMVGEEKVGQYERYLRLSSFGFHSGRIGLSRLALVPVA
jgi:cyclopropane-fatty-acyl-phospholipid synthase